jgi:hypothetical protein
VNLDRVRGLAQPDQRSCGPSSLVAARMLVDPAYTPTSFAADVLALHRRITGLWPRALGTPPWAVARSMAEVSGLPHRTHLVRWGDRSGDLAAVSDALADGHPCPLYVGDRWLPRHVVLVVGRTGDDLDVYNPAHGQVVTVTRAAFENGRLTTTGRWTRPWFSVRPRPPARRTGA